MKALVVTCRDPFRPANHRTLTLVRRRRSLANLAPRTSAPVVCQVNGQWVSRKAWARRVRDGDSVLFIQLPQGGGGGSNPMRLVLMLAVTLVAPQLAGFLNSSLELGLGKFGLSVLGGAIGMGGSMLVNALIPPPKPPQAQQAASLASPSPTYSLGAQGNQARIGQPIPVVYGRHIIYPDFGAMPYVEYSGNEQYLYQLFCLGQGEFDIESINIEDTPISSFAEITYEIVPPGANVTLFPTAVTTSIEVSGQEMSSAAGTYSQSGTTVTVTKASHGHLAGAKLWFGASTGDGVSGVVTVATAATDTFTFTAASATTSGNCIISPVLGPFVANAAGTEANAIGVDMVMSRGMYEANSSGGLNEVTISWRVEYQEIDDLGDPLGDWALLSTETMSAATTTPQRMSRKYGVAGSRYQVRVMRTDKKQTDSAFGHELDWGGLRTYLPGTQTYGNVTMVAMRLRATNNLSQQASRKINFVVTRKLPTWHPVTGWSSGATATRSIAWALADICRAQYGAGLADSRIDLQGLYDLDAIWSARGDTFDGVFDSQSTIMEALTQVSRAGRGIPFVQVGIVHVVRDSAATIPAGMFSQRNILKNSLKLEYIMPSEETSDCVDVTYFDSDIWSERTVRCTLPGGTSAKPAKVKLFGVTTRQQAWNEGMYIAACNLYRRRMLTFGTEMEGFIPALGDLIAVQHDMPKWGQSGEIVAWNSGTKTATLSEPVDWSAGGAHSFAMRKRDGSVAGPFTATAGSDLYHVILSDWVSGTDPVPDTTGDRERTHYAFGPANAQYIKCRVLAMRPKSQETVELAAVVESDYVHTADTGTAPGVTAWQLPSRFTAPVVLGLIARSAPDDVNYMALSWQPAAGADHYLIEQSGGDDTWTRVGETSAANYSVRALFGSATVVRIAAVGMTRGPWVSINYAGVADYMWVAGDDSAEMWSTGDDTATMW